MTSLDAFMPRLPRVLADLPWTPAAAVRVAAALTAAAVAIGLLGLATADSLGLVLLATLAIAGLFFVYGALAGYVRLDLAGPDATLEARIARQASTPLELIGPDGRTVYVNRAARDLLGSDAPSLEQLLAGSTASGDAAYRLSAAAARGDVAEELVTVRVGSSERASRSLRVGVRPFQPPITTDMVGRFTLWSAVDVTAEQTAVREAQAQAGRSLAAVDAMPVGLCTVERDGRILDMNDALRRIVGPMTEAKTWPDLTTIDGAARVMAALRAPLAGEPTRVDLDLIDEAGKLVPATVIVDGASHGPVSLVVVPRALVAGSGVLGGDDRFQRTFDSAPFGVATIDAEGRVVTANAAFLRLVPDETGPRHGIVHRLTSGAPAEQRSAVEAAILRSVSGRMSPAPVDVTIGGDTPTVRRVSVHPLTVGVDPREAAIVFVTDASEQKALEQRFAQSEKMEAIGTFVAGIAHDFNNVLGAIIGSSEHLLQLRREGDRGHSEAVQIRQTALRAAEMVKQLMAFTRQQTLQSQILDMNEAVQEFSAVLSVAITSRNTLRHDLGRDLWSVRADRTQVEQVLLNLARNAKDAMPKGGTLTIRTRNISERASVQLALPGMPSGEYVEIAVSDTGTGMAPEVLAKLFQPFFTTKDVGKGTGLGLASVYGIIKQTGGYIYPQSELGHGTTFRIFLPRYVPSEAEEAARAAAAAAEKAKAERPLDLTGTGRILLVEDEDFLRQVTARNLRKRGYDVLEAITGAEALEVLDAEGGRVDLVLSDVIMPEMDGPTMYREMLKSYPDLKVIFVSGYPSDAFDKGLDPATRFTFVQKPCPGDVLAAKVKEVISG
jgi:two-component system cell cycle sensor histidine kinase/response regulator CckA